MDSAVDGLGKLETETLWDKAFVQLSNAIYAGQFEPGSMLPLRSLAERFGTSITPVRDAVARLVALGVLERGTRNAALVPLVDADMLAHMTAVRRELEGLAAQEAAANGGQEAAEALSKKLELMKRMIRQGQFSTYLDAHRRFHFEIYAIAQNPILSQMIENLWLRFGPVLSFVIPEYVRSLKGTDHHEAVVHAIRNHDANVARKEVTADIQEATQYLLGLCGSDGFVRRHDGAVAGSSDRRAKGAAVGGR